MKIICVLIGVYEIDNECYFVKNYKLKYIFVLYFYYFFK